MSQYICQDTIILIGNLCQQSVSPSFKCQTTNDTCTQCLDIHQMIENDKCECYQGWMSDQNNHCVKFQLPCKTCSVNQNHCDSQNDNNHILKENFNCLFKDSFYTDFLGFCDPCQPLCAICKKNGFLTCLDTNQILINNQCQFQNGYYMKNYSCHECQTPCLNCSLNAHNSLSCLDDIKYILEQNLCNCRDGYYFSENLYLKCYLQCQTCVDDIKLDLTQ